jgi:leucyl-tRNA synthetase
MKDFLLLLAPFAPHLAEELFAKLEPKAPVALSYMPWPSYDPALLVEDTIEIPISVNGKVRDRITVPTNIAAQELERAALASEKLKPFLEGKMIKKVIVVPGKMVNIAAA